MNINFGLFPPVSLAREPDGTRLRGKQRQTARKHAYTSRALASFTTWLGECAGQNDPRRAMRQSVICRRHCGTSTT
jgi:hypothetical protein